MKGLHDPAPFVVRGIMVSFRLTANDWQTRPSPRKTALGAMMIAGGDEPFAACIFCSIFIVKFITLSNRERIIRGAETGHRILDESTLLESLTAKQREVMDLLIEHKTSKEIARILQISPHTVDQRIQFAKDKLGANSRNEAAVVYRRLIAISGQSIYEDSGVAVSAGAAHDLLARPVANIGTEQGTRTQSTPAADPELDYAVVRELFDGRHGTLARVGAIVAIAVSLVIVVVGGITIISQLSSLLTG